MGIIGPDWFRTTSGAAGILYWDKEGPEQDVISLVLTSPRAPETRWSWQVEQGDAFTYHGVSADRFLAEREAEAAALLGEEYWAVVFQGFVPVSEDEPTLVVEER